ncbi:MAG: phospholipase A [Lysobacteraceae bacterium]
MRCVLALLAFTCTLPALAAEQDAEAAAHKASICGGMPTDIERLACYDELFRITPEDTAAADAAAAEAAQALPPTTLTGLIEAYRKGEEATQDEVLPVDGRRHAQALANAGRGSLLDRRWELAKDSKLGVYNLRAYKPVYALPFYWNSATNQNPESPNPNNTVEDGQHTQPIEGKFQLSFKTKLWENIFGDNGDLWGAYTQSSHWQMFNSEESRPFRETNYEPELMLVFRNRYHLLGWNGRMAGIGFNHQSNGRGDPESRSWNRIVANIGLDRGNWALMLRPWWRLPEGKREDNNPDIEDYIGRGEAMLVYHRDGYELALTARHSLRSGSRSHGALQLDWSFPLDGPLRGYVQIFDGYGESLIDYNHKATYLGLGISLIDWF